MIAARNASLALGSRDARVEILRGLDLDVARGSRVALLGASGSGKSSLMALLTGLERASGGTITVATGLDEKCAFLSVADNGPGIPPERLADLFKAFSTGKRNGMGLGLAISRTIVQSHGGELLVDPGGRRRHAPRVRAPRGPLVVR